MPLLVSVMRPPRGRETLRPYPRSRAPTSSTAERAGRPPAAPAALAQPNVITRTGAFDMLIDEVPRLQKLAETVPALLTEIGVI